MAFQELSSNFRNCRQSSPGRTTWWYLMNLEGKPNGQFGTTRSRSQHSTSVYDRYRITWAIGCFENFGSFVKPMFGRLVNVANSTRTQHYEMRMNNCRSSNGLRI